MINDPLPRLDQNPDLSASLIEECRLRPGEIWTDPVSGHRVGCLDAARTDDVALLMDSAQAKLAIHDPPYNFIACQQSGWDDYVDWSQQWITAAVSAMARDSSFYLWLGADQNDGFRPLPEIMMLMRQTGLESRSFLTMRNQRGYGTPKNWMAVRQELLYYTSGNPPFDVAAEYTDIPKILRGYYKDVAGQRTENGERGKSDCIRAGNVWVDVQQVFYRMEENVTGCYAQKPLKAIARIVSASSAPRDIVIDFFAHSGTTLLAAEKSGRRCYTMDIDPIFCEITIRRLLHYRATGQCGWQNRNPFAVYDPEQRALAFA